MKIHRFGLGRVAALAWLLAIFGASTAHPADFPGRTFHFDIPAGALSQALRTFGQTAGEQIIFTEDLVSGVSSEGLKGDFTADAALHRLLGSVGLSAERNAAGVIMIRRQPSARTTTGTAASSRVAPLAAAAAVSQSGPAPDLTDQRNGNSDAQALDRRKKDELLEEVVVTGTHLKDVTDTASPVMVFTRANIDQSGLGSVGAFIQRLPQNFSNVSESTIASVAGGIGADNAVNASAVNLHGMGGDATLVLVDGHRVAPGNVDGNFVDVSMIPLSAVERIEILTDGASAIYGSDAVGGVVNIIMRKDFDGLESRARFGTVTDGSSHETQIGQSAGKNWGTGSALLTYEFYDRTPLSAADRPYTSGVPLPFTLLPEQIRQSVFASIDQSVNDDLSLFADGLYSHRGTHTDATVVGAFSQHSPATIDGYSATAGGRWRIARKTELDLTGGYAANDSHTAAYDLGSPDAVASANTRTSLWTVDAVLRGALGSAPGGPLQYALGAQYRHESYDANDYIAHTLFKPRREVEAGFLELRVPLIGIANDIPFARRLELTLADRQEHYSDFGSTNNPTIGLIWQPLSALKFRGTYGRSFVAPLLSELNPVPFEIVGFNTALVPGTAPPGGDVNELVEFGGNPNLKAQRAKTWTLGVDWDAGGPHPLRAHLNYYAIEFTDRITNLQGAGFNVFYALPMAAVLGPQVVRTNPSTALVQQLVSSPSYVDFGTFGTDFAAVIDSRELNLSSVDTRGLDLSVSYHFTIGPIGLEPGIDANYILKLTNQFTSTTPTVNTVNTLYNPTRVKARGHLTVTDGPFDVAAFVNYASSYKNNVTAGDVVPISAWTTIDMTASYACQSCQGLLRDFGVTLGVINLANRAPPFAANANGFAVNYDGANASPLGRYLFLQLTKRW
ncbi:MAG TPA: TonB-dependent receptor [Steroidobacteraceae bacterium]|jgi:outer membrane receptor protein involved in Fe transport|nr:TonB-dependent receptor [Steroidobacteraceae bacterium]